MACRSARRQLRTRHLNIHIQNNSTIIKKGKDLEEPYRANTTEGWGERKKSDGDSFGVERMDAVGNRKSWVERGEKAKPGNGFESRLLKNGGGGTENERGWTVESLNLSDSRAAKKAT